MNDQEEDRVDNEDDGIPGYRDSPHASRLRGRTEGTEPRDS